jgi:hypothetical protein
MDERGALTFCEQDHPLPFRLARAYFVHGIPPGAERGGHAHRRVREVVVAAAGCFRVTLTSPGREVLRFTLDDATSGLYVPPYWWRMIDSYSPNSLCLVLASELFDEAEYIREPDDFFSC